MAKRMSHHVFGKVLSAGSIQRNQALLIPFLLVPSLQGIKQKSPQPFVAQTKENNEAIFKLPGRSHRPTKLYNSERH
jgi:hypothetical protein